VRRADLPGDSAEQQYVTLGTHVGTHMDAPGTITRYRKVEKAKTIDELPVEWF
jgi:kynurenine formamidase